MKGTPDPVFQLENEKGRPQIGHFVQSGQGRAHFSENEL